MPQLLGEVACGPRLDLMGQRLVAREVPVRDALIKGGVDGVAVLVLTSLFLDRRVVGSAPMARVAANPR